MCLAAWLGGGSKTFWFGSFVSLVILIELWLSAHIALLSFVNSGPLVVTSLSFTRFTLCIGKITRWWSRPAGLGVWFWVGFLGSSFFSPSSVFSSLPSTMTWAPRPHSWRKKNHIALLPVQNTLMLRGLCLGLCLPLAFGGLMAEAESAILRPPNPVQAVLCRDRSCRQENGQSSKNDFFPNQPISIPACHFHQMHNLCPGILYMEFNLLILGHCHFTNKKRKGKNAQKKLLVVNLHRTRRLKIYTEQKS